MSCSWTSEQKLEIISLEESSDKLFQAEKYAEALEKLKKLHSKLLQLDLTRFKTLVMMAECNIFLDKFDEAIRYIKKFMDPSERFLTFRNTASTIGQSVNCQESKLIFRSLNIAWRACAMNAYQPPSQTSLEKTIESMQIMNELLLKVSDEYGFIESKSKDCTRFAKIHVRLLLDFGEKLESLGKSGEFANPNIASLLNEVRLHRAAGIASCYLLLKNFEKSVEYFDKYISLAGDEASSNTLKFCVVGKLAVKVSSCHEAAQSELTKMEKHVTETRVAMAKYEPTDEHDAVLLNDMSKFMEDYVANVRNVGRLKLAAFTNLLSLFFRH